MHVSPRPELEQRFDDLTPRQKAVVAARVQNPDATNRDIAHTIAPRIYNEEQKPPEKEPIDKMNESYTSQFQNKDEIKELIKYRQEIRDNQRYEGETTTTGDPFSGNPAMQSQREQSRGWQSITERPVQQTNDQSQQQEPPKPRYEFQAPVRVEKKENAWTVEFEPEYFQHLLSSKRLPPELHQELVEAVIEAKTS